MTRSDLEAMFRAIDANDWSRLATFFHSDLSYDRPGFPAMVGKEAVVRFYQEVRSIRGVHLFEGMAVDGQYGAAWGRFEGKQLTGEPVDVQFADCYQFKDGLLWRRKSHFYTPMV